MKLGVVMYMYAKYCVIAVRGFFKFSGRYFLERPVAIIFNFYIRMFKKFALCNVSF